MRLPRTVVVSTDYRFQGTPDGRVWTALANDAAFWRQCYQAFDQIVVVARVAEVEAIPTGGREVAGEGVSVVNLPDFHTPVEMARALPGIISAIRRIAPKEHFLVAELGIVGLLLASATRLRRRPYIASLIGDPDAVFGQAQVGGRWRELYRRSFTSATRAACRRATGVWYVARFLAAKYPPGPDAVTLVQPAYFLIDDEPPSGLRPPTRTVRRLITVGALDQPYKGVADLLEAMALLVGRGADIELTVVGGGRLQPTLVEHARALGLSERTRFTGWVGSDRVKELLSDSDLFVLASHTEGQPRALIEAMAMGLPCVATQVGGIPDLLPDDVLVTPRSPPELAQRIEVFVGDPSYAASEGRANLERSSPYRPRPRAIELERFFAAACGTAAASAR